MARILVVDDEELARFTIRDILETAGHEVAEAENGNEAISAHNANPFDLVITDIVMPEKEGLETIVELRHDHPKLKIIAISGGGGTRNEDYLKLTTDLLNLAEDLGADNILAKPFSKDELLECVNTCLSG